MPVLETFVYRKMEKPDGDYIDKDGKRWDIQSCHYAEEYEYQQVETETIIDEEGHEIEVPVYEWVVVINKGWDSFDSLEEAEKAYGLTKVEPDEVENADEN